MTENWYHLISQYGYIAIFLLIALGFTGIPVPGIILLIYSGFLISIGKLHFVLVLLTALSGVLCGVSISYLLGLEMGESFLYKIAPKLLIKKSTIKRSDRLFRKYGSFIVLISYFIPGVKKINAYLAGMTHFSFKRFALFAYSGALLWVFFFLAVGRLLGRNWQTVTTYFIEYSWATILTGIIAIIVFIIYIVKRRQKRTFK